MESVVKEIQFTHRYWVLLLPLILMSADIVTGWIQATINGTWDSTKMRTGLFRKSGEMLVIILAWAISVAIRESGSGRRPDAGMDHAQAEEGRAGSVQRR